MFRDAIRHMLAAILMAGTLAGTIWTFSDGTLTLNGALERLVTVGGVAAALEIGVIYLGWYIGQLDLRIHSARKRDDAQAYRKYQAELYRWFWAIVAFSAIANFIFRVEQVHNWALAAFVSVVPIVLIVVFTIKLRPLPQDFEEKGRQATQLALVRAVEAASGMMVTAFERIGRGDKDPALLEAARLGVAMAGIYAPTEQQHALGHFITQAGGGEPQTVDGSVEERWLSSREIQDAYAIPERTAQDKMRRVPGRRKASKGNAWLVPASAYYRMYGTPAPVRASDARQMGLPGSAVSSIVLAYHDGPTAI